MSLNTIQLGSILEREIYELVDVFRELTIVNLRLEELIREVFRGIFESSSQALKALKDAIQACIGLPVDRVECVKRPSGVYIIATVSGDAKTVMERWLFVADKLGRLGPILINWNGETNISPQEAGRYLGEIFAKMGMRLSWITSFNAVELLREEWGE
jgi:hypothetical protein